MGCINVKLVCLIIFVGVCTYLSSILGMYGVYVGYCMGIMFMGIIVYSIYMVLICCVYLCCICLFINLI